MRSIRAPNSAEGGRFLLTKYQYLAESALSGIFLGDGISPGPNRLRRPQKRQTCSTRPNTYPAAARELGCRVSKTDVIEARRGRLYNSSHASK